MLNTCGKDAIWNEESSDSNANQHQELEEPEAERNRRKVKYIQNECFCHHVRTIERVQSTCLATRVQHIVITQDHGTEAAVLSTNPFWMAARGSLLLRTRIMMMEKRKKKQAMAKHMRYTDL